MKQIKNVIAVFALAIGLMFAQSCADPCKDVECGANGTCVEGVCECNAGFEGDQCETEMRTKFLKTGATVSETCGGTNTPAYTVDIIKGNAIDAVRIKNLGNYDCSGTTSEYYVEGTVSGTSLTIPQQTVNILTCSITFSGSGSVSGTSVSITYTATYTGGSDNCTVSL